MYKVMQNIELEKHEMRVTFASVLQDLCAKDKKVVYLDADLMNSVGTTKFANENPSQVINCGIQEANMIGTAAGMSATGLIPFVHTFATFATRRVMDQVFISGAYAKLNVRIVGSDPGIIASTNGGTHMPFEDIGMMRCVPEVTILEPVDSIMLEDIMRQTKDKYGVFYIRLSRKQCEKIYEDGSTFEIGKAPLLREGTDATIFATGVTVAEALKAHDILKSEGISVRVHNMFTIKPIDKDAIIKASKETGAIVTTENHNIINGLGSAVSEVLSENAPCALERIGVKDMFGEVGDVEYLKKRFELTAQDIVLSVKKAISRK